MLMYRVKRCKSDYPNLPQLDKQKELEPLPLELYCKKPVQFYKKESVSNNINGIDVKEIPQRKVVSANLLDGVTRSRSIKERWYVRKSYY
jgi:hypothetical protein